jgi:glutamyl-tRNA reductase
MSFSEPSHKHQVLFAVGINHRTAPLEVRESAYVHDAEIPSLLSLLNETLDEAAVISTCNRTEIYGVTSRLDRDLDFYKDLLIDFKDARNHLNRDHFFGLVSCAACKQLFSVATSLDSQIVGDSQVLGQVREAYERARDHRTAGRVINQLFQRSFKLGRSVRHETRLHRGAVSVSRAAVEDASRHFGSLRDKTAVIVGAGDSSRRSAEALLERNIRNLVIANRTVTHAETLAAGLNKSRQSMIRTVPLEALTSELAEADVVISSTDSRLPVLRRSSFTSYRPGLMLFDLAVPRDIAEDVCELNGVTLRNLDDVNLTIEDNHRKRTEDIPVASRLLADEMSDFLVWYYSQPILGPSTFDRACRDKKMEAEILRTKQFLLANAGQLHRMAMAEGAASFAGHMHVVDQLKEMRDVAFGSGEVS